MNSPPWDPDRPLTAQGARAVIAACFPEVDSRTLKYLGSGWEFDAYLTTDGWAFRFPRRAWCADLFESERRVHELVSRVLAPKIAVPKVELMGEPTDGFPYRFAGHRFISGVPADTLNSDFEATLARGIGRALEAIHSIPEEEARAAGVVELDSEEPGRKDWLKRGLDLASRLRGLVRARHRFRTQLGCGRIVAAPSIRRSAPRHPPRPIPGASDCRAEVRSARWNH